MGRGVIHQVGTPEEVFEQPADRFVAEFMGCTTFLPCEVVGMDRVRLLLGEETPCVSCPLPSGAAGRGVVGLRAQEVHLARDTSKALTGHVSLRTYLGGSFEVRVRVGNHVIPLITTSPLREGDTVQFVLGPVRFFPDVSCAIPGEVPRATVM